MPTRSQNKPQAKKCTCNFVYIVLAWILFTIGIYVFVSAFVSQFQGLATVSEILVTYFIGIVILTLGKWSKWKGVGCCTIHK